MEQNIVIWYYPYFIQTEIGRIVDLVKIIYSRNQNLQKQS